MFESKLNRGRAGGYAPLDGSGKVPLGNLPPIQSTIDTSSLVTNGKTGSFATTGSNIFTGVQTISGTSGTAGASFDIGQLGYTAPNSFDIRVNGSGSGYSSFTSDFSSVVGAINGGYTPTSTASLFANSLIGYPYTQDPIALIGLQKGDKEKQWLFDFSGSANFPGDINIGYPTVFGITSGSLNVTNGNINVSGSVNVSSSLVVSSTVINNGTIDALNSDLIIDGGYLIMTSSAAPLGPTGSFGDKGGMVVFDNNFLYYCTADYLPFTASVPAVPGFSVTASGATHTYNAEPGSVWNTYNNGGPSYWLQVGPSQEGDGTSPAPVSGWYFVDDNGTIRQITSDNFWAGGNPPTPINNGTGWLCSVDGAWTYSEITNSTLTLHESLPTVNFGGGTPAVEGNPGSGEIWTKTKLESTPNYAPFGSGSFDVASTDITKLDITKDIHVLDVTDMTSFTAWFLPDGLYDGQVVRFAIKSGNPSVNANNIYIYMNNLTTWNGWTESNASWCPFYDDGNASARSLATAVYIDGAWNIDTDWWNMY